MLLQLNPIMDMLAWTQKYKRIYILYMQTDTYTYKHTHFSKNNFKIPSLPIAGRLWVCLWFENQKGKKITMTHTQALITIQQFYKSRIYNSDAVDKVLQMELQWFTHYNCIFNKIFSKSETATHIRSRSSVIIKRPSQKFYVISIQLF